MTNGRLTIKKRARRPELALPASAVSVSAAFADDAAPGRAAAGQPPFDRIDLYGLLAEAAVDLAASAEAVRAAQVWGDDAAPSALAAARRAARRILAALPDDA